MKIVRVAFVAVAVCGTALLLPGCYEEQVVMMRTEPIPMTEQQVINMVKNAAPSSDIIRAIRESGTIFRLSASDVENLKKEGVPEEVIDYMLSTREAPPAIVRSPVVVYDPWWAWDYAYVPGYWYYPAHVGFGFSYARFGGGVRHYGYGLHFGHWR